MTTAEKTRENRLRAAVDRQGFRLHKVRRMDPRAIDYGHYRITDPATGAVVAEVSDMDALERWTKGES